MVINSGISMTSCRAWISCRKILVGGTRLLKIRGPEERGTISVTVLHSTLLLPLRVFLPIPVATVSHVDNGRRAHVSRNTILGLSQRPLVDNGSARASIMEGSCTRHVSGIAVVVCSVILTSSETDSSASLCSDLAVSSESNYAV